MRYTTVGDFVNVMDEYPDPEALAVQANKGHAEEILNNEQVRIVVPLDEAASKYYGQGTRWCTASINNNMFDSYNRDGPLYILIPKNPLHQGEKYQIHFAEYQFMDETDQPVDPYNLLTKRFGNLFHFFVERHPEIQETILFADSQLLQRLLDKISDAGMEPVYEILSNWQEADYSGYYQWLEYMGYVYPEDHPEAGMIDWDKVDDAGVDFTDYSDEASNFLSTAEFALKVTIPQIRELAVGDESHIPLLPHLPALVARHVDGVASYGSRAFRGHLWEVAELLKSRVVVMAKKSSGPTAEPEWNVYITRYDKGHEKRFDLVQ